jgi:S1-C subfamily serine protease
MSEIQNERHTILGRLSPDAEERLALELLNFFFPPHANSFRVSIGLPPLNPVEPLCIEQFFNWARLTHRSPLYDRVRPHILNLVKKMTGAGLLSYEGRGASTSVMGNADHYYALHERSSGAIKGNLYLGQVLGAPFIAHKIQKALVAITGRDKTTMDPAVGTGIHVLSAYIVTCRHVVEDMDLDETIHVNGHTARVLECHFDRSSPIDVGAVRISAVEPFLPDLQFRSASLLEEILVAGYPSVPTTLGGFASFQRGEICQIGVPTMWKNELELFSAIARPGNSGGPLVTLEGNIVGLVTQSLEREKEEKDKLNPLPFFAAVPASDVQLMFKQLTGLDLPWEDYQ